MTEDLKKYLRIDKFALDTELVNQASLFYKISELYTDAVAIRDTVKEELAVIDAEIEQKIRSQHCGDQNGKGPTEGKIKGLLTLDTGHKLAVEEYLKAKAEADRLEALKDAFRQRSTMLKHLAELYIANYFSSDAVKADPMTDDTVYKIRRKSMAKGQ